MIAGIIAAGEGTRLKSEGIASPKPLVEVGGTPIIGRLLKSLANAGISSVCCIINEDSTEVRDYVESLLLPIPVSFLVKSTPSSMHSLFELSPRLRGGKFLLTTVDSIFAESDLRDFLAAGEDDGAPDGLLAVTDYVDDENPLFVETGKDGRVTSFSKSGRSPWITGGLYIFHPRIFDEIPDARRLGIERLRNFLSHLVRSGYDLRTHRFSKIVDVDHVRDIRTAERMLDGR
ncbi:MAG TPA: NDP-sugar synthase [Bacteroidota bacterium]|nr:NDP-sugar synthase [Bacteroidota bacterium]